MTFESVQEMAKYGKRNHLSLYAYKGVVYDMTPFVMNHPGGEIEILQFEGEPIDDVIFNPNFHRHHPQMIVKLQQYQVGHIIKNDAVKPTSKMKSEKLIISNTRKQLQECVQPQQQIPEDTSIEQIPIFQTKQFHSQRHIEIKFK